jgi:hypothetical protein
MFKDVKRGQSPDRNKAVVVWNGNKSVGLSSIHATDNIVEVLPATANVCRQKAPTSRISAVKTNRQLYEEAYWNFVNSTTYDDAVKYKNQMEEYVDLSLEPDGENWSSWVKDPVVSKELEKEHKGFGFFLMMLFVIGVTGFWVYSLVSDLIGWVS